MLNCEYKYIYIHILDAAGEATVASRPGESSGEKGEASEAVEVGEGSAVPGCLPAARRGPTTGASSNHSSGSVPSVAAERSPATAAAGFCDGRFVLCRLIVTTSLVHPRVS